MVTWFKVLTILIFGPFVWSSDEDWRVQLHNDRYEDFFKRHKEDEAYDERREAGAAEVTAERERWNKEQELARQSFVKDRKPPLDSTPAYKEWEQEITNWYERLALAEKRYSTVEREIKKLQDSAKKIPENVEYDIEP